MSTEKTLIAILLLGLGLAVLGCHSEEDSQNLGDKLNSSSTNRGHSRNGDGDDSLSVWNCTTIDARYKTCLSRLEPKKAQEIGRAFEKMTGEQGTWDGGLLDLKAFRNWSGLDQTDSECLKSKLCKELRINADN